MLDTTLWGWKSCRAYYDANACVSRTKEVADTMHHQMRLYSLLAHERSIHSDIFSFILIYK